MTIGTRGGWIATAVLAVALYGCGGDNTGPGPGPGPGAADSVPQLVAEVAVPPNYGIHDTFVRDGLAFVSAWNTGLIIYDVGNGIRGGTPAAPVEVGRVVPAANGTGGAQTHNSWWFHNPNNGEKRYLFVGQEGPGAIGTSSLGDIHVIDVSNLAAPQEVAFFHLPAVDADSVGTHNFWMDEPGQILYAAYYNGGVVALDVSGTLSGDLASRLIADIQPGGPGNTFTWGVQLVGDKLYANDMLSGLWVLQLNGHVFNLLGGGNNVPDRYGSDLWVANGYAYTGTWGSATRNGNHGDVLKVWRLAASGTPSLVDSVKVQGAGNISDDEVSADNKYLLVTVEGFDAASRGLHLYSLADPAKPHRIGSYAVPNGLHTGTFATINGRRYVFAARNPGSTDGPALMIFDVTAMTP